MRKKWMILAGCFFAGVLLCGLGAGICFAEFSDFTYAGNVKTGKSVEETLTYTADDEMDAYYVYMPDNAGRMKQTEVVSDNTLAKEQIEIDVTYNDDYEKPFLHDWIYTAETEEETVEEETIEEETIIEETAEEEETVVEAEGDIPMASDAAAATQDERQICEIWISCPMDEMKVFMKYKDIILEDIKNKKIGSYTSTPYYEVTVRCNPDMVDKITLVN
jgi:hypothetical protein